MQPVVVTPPSGTPPLGFASLVFVSGAALFAVHLLVFGGTGAASLALLLMASIGAALLVLVHPRFENRTVAQMLAAFWSNLPVRISALTVVGLAELYAVFVGGRGLLRERALDAQLAATDPCAAVAAPLQDWATKKQRDTHAVRTGECDRQLAEQKTAEQHRKCAEAMVHLEARKVTPEDHVVLGSFAEVAQRVASRKLEAKDLEYISQAHMPCREHPDIVARAWAAYVAAAQESPAWGSVESANGVQGRLRDSLKSAHISAPNAEVLAKTVVQKSLTATQTGTKTADLRPARELCQLQNDVAGAESDECALLEGKYQTLLKAEEAKAEQERKIAEAKAEQERKIAEAKEKAEQAAAEAKERQEQAIEDAKTARFRACTEQCDRLPEGPAYDACSDRCLGFDRPLF